MDWKKYLARMSQNENVHVLLLFLAGMAVLTVLARVADSFMVPQVSVGKAVEMRLQYPMEIEGRIRAKGEQAMYCRENLRVAQVLVQKGDSVKKGDVLFTLDKEDLQGQIKEAEQEIRKYELQIEDAKQAYQKQAAQQSRAYERAKEDYQDAQKAAKAAQEEAYLEMEQAREALEQHDGAKPEEAQGQYHSSDGDAKPDGRGKAEGTGNLEPEEGKIAEEEAAIVPGGGKAEDASQTYPRGDKERAKEAGENDAGEGRKEERAGEEEVNLQGNKEKGKDAGEVNPRGDKERAKEAGENDAGEGRKEEGKKEAEEMDIGPNADKNEEEKIGEGNGEGASELDIPVDKESAFSIWLQKREELAQQYADKQKQYQDAAASTAEAVKTAARQVEDCMDGVSKDNAETLLQLEKEKLSSSLQGLKELEQADGKVYAEQDGRILECFLSTGGRTSAEPALVFEDLSQPLQFEGTVSWQPGLSIEEGLECSLQAKGEPVPVEGLKITKVTEEAMEGPESRAYCVIAEIGTGRVSQTGEATLSVTRESQRYPNCVPVSALYSGSAGDYIIGIQEDITILGVQAVAEIIPVTPMEENGEYVAVKESLAAYEAIAIHASKSIKEGDRVRIVRGK